MSIPVLAPSLFESASSSATAHTRLAGNYAKGCCATAGGVVTNEGTSNLVERSTYTWTQQVEEQGGGDDNASAAGKYFPS